MVVQQGPTFSTQFRPDRGMIETRRKALFLDRDGVINVERGHVHCRESFEFIPGIFELCRAAQTLGYLLVVVTNQAGIARGYYSESDFRNLTDWMMAQLAERKVSITRLYYCPYHPVFGVGRYKYDSPDRKPNPGMLLRAQSDLDLDLESSILIGDKLSDIQAGCAAGVGTQILLSSERPEGQHPEISCHVYSSLDGVRLSFFSGGKNVIRNPSSMRWDSVTTTREDG
jgi:D-glycero-D-manno-heptose 1,7-bisphosphate phosphatase